MILVIFITHNKNSLFIARKGVVISIVPLNGKTFALKKKESLSWKPLFKVLSWAQSAPSPLGVAKSSIVDPLECFFSTYLVNPQLSHDDVVHRGGNLLPSVVIVALFKDGVNGACGLLT